MFRSSPQQAIPYEYPALASPITRMQLSADDNYLFVAGNDGVLVMFEVRDKDGRAPRSDITGPWSSHVLVRSSFIHVFPSFFRALLSPPLPRFLQVTRGDLEERKSAIKELRDKVASLQSNNQHVLRVAKMSFQEDLRKVGALSILPPSSSWAYCSTLCLSFAKSTTPCWNRSDSSLNC